MYFRRFVKLIISFVLSFVIIFYLLNTMSSVSTEYSFKLNIKGPSNEIVQLYYAEDEKYSEELSVTSEIENSQLIETHRFKVSQGLDNLRIDLGSNPGNWYIEEIAFQSLFNDYKTEISPSVFVKNNQIDKITQSPDGLLMIKTMGTDPYFQLMMPATIKEQLKKDNHMKMLYQNAAVSLIPALLVVIVLLRRRQVWNWVKMLREKRSLIGNLAKNDFKTKYAGSYLGVIWAFIQPIMTVLIYWFVFQIGFKAGPIQDFPFILWLIAGMVPWFFFSDALMNATNSMLEYNYLVKKLVFQIDILPVVKHLASLFVHLFFIILTISIFMVYGYTPQLPAIQIIYYTICAFMLSYSLSILCCALIVFFKDLGQILSLVLQFGMWITPILWNNTMVPEGYRWLLKINPMYYVVEGYRDALLGEVWFWDRFYQTVYFWSFCIVFLIIGSIVFKRLRPHFADVL